MDNHVAEEDKELFKDRMSNLHLGLFLGLIKSMISRSEKPLSDSGALAQMTKNIMLKHFIGRTNTINIKNLDLFISEVKRMGNNKKEVINPSIMDLDHTPELNYFEKFVLFQRRLNNNLPRYNRLEIWDSVIMNYFYFVSYNLLLFIFIKILIVDQSYWLVLDPIGIFLLLISLGYMN